MGLRLGLGLGLALALTLTLLLTQVTWVTRRWLGALW